MVGLSALRTGRLDTDRTYAVKVPKLIASIKAPTTHREIASRESCFGPVSVPRSMLMCTRGMGWERGEVPLTWPPRFER